MKNSAYMYSILDNQIERLNFKITNSFLIIVAIFLEVIFLMVSHNVPRLTQNFLYVLQNNLELLIICLYLPSATIDVTPQQVCASLGIEPRLCGARHVPYQIT